MEELISVKEYKLFNIILECNNNLGLFEKNKLSGMQQLFESFDESKKPEVIVDYTKFNDNNYAYGREVLRILNDLSSDVVLNEAINYFNKYNQIKFTHFKDELKKYVSNLERINDFNVLDGLNPTVVKTKILLRRPVNIFGFDIINNIHLQQVIFDKFGLKQTDIMRVIYDKSNKQIIFEYSSLYITYNIENNEFEQLSKNTGETINNVFGNNIITLQDNFTNTVNNDNWDNLYADNFKRSVMEAFINKNKIVK